MLGMKNFTHPPSEGVFHCIRKVLLSQRKNLTIFLKKTTKTLSRLEVFILLYIA